MDSNQRSSVSRMIFETDDDDILSKIKKQSIKMEPMEDDESTLVLSPEKYHQYSNSRETIEISDDEDVPVDDNRHSKPSQSSSRPIVYRVRVVCHSMETQTEIKMKDVETSTDDFETYLANIADNTLVTDKNIIKKEDDVKATVCGETSWARSSETDNTENALNESNAAEIKEGNTNIKPDLIRNVNVNISQTNPKPNIQKKTEPKKQKKMEPKIEKEYYRCRICSCFYLSYNVFKKHVQLMHKKKNVPSKPLVPFEARCKFCKYKCKNKNYYNNHIRRKHMKRYDKTRDTKPADIKGSNSALKVRDILDMMTSEAKELLKPPTPSKLKEKKIKEKIIPKSILYKCCNCSTHFLSFKNASKHAEKCENADYENKQIIVACSICQRNFCNQTIQHHYIQHKHTDSFTTHVINERVIDKYLYKCPTCHVCFNEKKFNSHRNRKMCFKNNTDRNMDCNKCDLRIAEECYIDHERLHQAWKYVQNYFVVVADLLINSN